MPATDGEQPDLILHVDNTDPAKIMKVLADSGFTAEIRER